MNELLIFIAIAISITLCTEQIKKTWDMIKGIIIAVKTKKDLLNSIKFGLIIAQALGVWAIFSFNIGIISILGLEYTSIGFKYFDLFTTAFICSGGASVVYSWYEQVNKKNEKKA